jgi:AraC-like DNA-binding protein
MIPADVAHRWGFHPLDQFARYYRQQFGELPSMTAYPERMDF